MKEDFMNEEPVFAENNTSEITACRARMKEILDSREGEIPFGFRNGYMFRAVLQRKPAVLRDFLRILLSLPADSTLQCEILNPIALGNPVYGNGSPLRVRFTVDNRLSGSASLNVLRNTSGTCLKAEFEFESDVDALPEALTGGAASTFGEATPSRKCSELHDFTDTLFTTEWEELHSHRADSPVLQQFAEALADLETRPEVIRQCILCEDRYLEDLYRTAISGDTAHLRMLAREQRRHLRNLHTFLEI